jgi:hypothetical protein
VGFGLIVISIGPASMFFHAALTRWSQWIDQVSNHLVTGWLIAYAVTRSGNLGQAWFVGILSAVLFAAIAVILTWTHLGPLVFGTASVVAFGCVVWLVLAKWEVPRTAGWRWLGASVATLGCGFFFRWASEKEGRPMYDPETWMQGHAIWHVLGACSLLVLFYFLRSEERRGVASLRGWE